MWKGEDKCVWVPRTAGVAQWEGMLVSPLNRRRLHRSRISWPQPNIKEGSLCWPFLSLEQIIKKIQGDPGKTISKNLSVSSLNKLKDTGEAGQKDLAMRSRAKKPFSISQRLRWFCYSSQPAWLVPVAPRLPFPTEKHRNKQRSS